MVPMLPTKKFCLCFTPKTGTVVLGCLGILFFVLMMVPHVLILQHHEFYIKEFVKEQRRTTGGMDITEEDVPKIAFCSQMVWSFAIAYDVIFTFASIFLITGVAADKHYLLLPWLVVTFFSMLYYLVMVLAAMFKFANYTSLCIFAMAAPIFLLFLYLWYNVLVTFHQIRREKDLVATPGGGNVNLPATRSDILRAKREGHRLEAAGKMVGPKEDQRPKVVPEQPSTATSISLASAATAEEVTKSASVATSLGSFKSSIRRAIAATPPPPYEAVAIDIDKEVEALAQGLGSQELVYVRNETTGLLEEVSSTGSSAEKTKSLTSSESKDEEDDLLLSPDSIQSLGETEIMISQP